MTKMNFFILCFAGIEARGFIFGPPIALAIGAKFVPLRKPKKLPGMYSFNCSFNILFSDFLLRNSLFGVRQSNFSRVHIGIRKGLS